jgi:hypothetical protein
VISTLRRVDQTPVRDRQNPRAELPLVSPEAMDVPNQIEEYRADEVLRIGGAPASEITEHDRGQAPVELLPCPRFVIPSPGQDG